MRILRALGLALLLLAGLEAVVAVRVPSQDRTPLPWRTDRAIPWGADLPNGVHRTWLGQLASRTRPPGRLRIAVFGSSAVAGIGTTPFHSFPWRLQRRLERRGMDAEVLNFGLSGHDSGHHRAAVLKALQELQPSIVVVYAGNNELHRLRIHKYLSPLWSAEWEEVRLLLERLALYRALAGRLAPTPQNVTHVGLHDIPSRATAADRELATHVYRRNLQGIVDAGRSARVPVVLCTVASNDLAPPDYSRPGDTPSHRLHDQAVEALLRGEAAQARRLFDESRELDPAPRRVLPSWNEVVRDQQGVLLCDVEERLRREAPDGILGEDLFLDGCHFRPAGNERVAEILEEALAPLLPEPRLAPSTADGGGLEDLDPADPPEEYGPFVRELQGVPEGLAAMDALREAAERSPERPYLWRDVARAAVRTARFDEAREAARRYLRTGADPALSRDLQLLEQGKAP